MNISLPVYRIFMFCWIGVAVVIFLLLLRINAPYGRHSHERWGPQMDNHLGWLLMESPALAVMLYYFIVLFNGSVAVTIMIGMFVLHYLNRTLVFPFRLHTRGKKMPLVIVLMAIVFNLINTFFIGFYFKQFAFYPVDYLRSPQFISGIGIFILGAGINSWADNKLIHLRRPAETGYRIPEGGLFRYVSCPNLLGELIEWGGFAICCWNLPALAFFTWTAANLLPRALAHHQWYKMHFDGYPVTRKAILPFLW